MGRGSVRKIGRLGVVAAIVTTGVVWEAGAARAAAFPATTPTRLYMAPTGTTLLAGLVGVPIGTLPFGPPDSDPISGDTRDLTVDVDPGPLGCDTTTDQPVGVPDYDLDDCPRLQLDVIHGRLTLANATKLERDYLTDPDGGGPLVAGDPNPNDVAWRLPGGAIVSQIGGGGDPATPNDPEGHLGYHLSGLEGQINLALDDMSYVPDDGYYYTGTASEERLHMLLVSGDPAVSSATHDVEIRVLDVNDAASLSGPASASAQPEVELFLPEVAPGVTWPYTGSLWAVADEDNDEVIDDDDGEPLPDGAGDKMLLVGYLDCGVPTVDDQTGFRLRGGSFQADDADIEDLLTDFYELTTAPTEVQTAVGGLLDALDLIVPGLTNIPLATSDPFIYNDIFAGIGTIDDVAYALSQVRFLSDAEVDTCTLYTVVSDLGNNGLPLQYIGDPPTGVEVPFLGVPPIDIVETEITVGGLETITVRFDPATQAVLEGATASATILIDPPTHPAFDLRIRTVDGTAVAGDDYAGVTPYATVAVGQDVASVQFDTTTLDDGDPEPVETFLFELIVPTDPPGSPSGFFRPFGFEVVSTQSTQTVSIVDDDGTPSTILDVSDPSVVEGDAGTTNLVFDVTLSGPATGAEEFVATTVDGSATDVDDYEPFATQPITFDVGETVGQVTVIVNGDTDIEPDENLTLDVAAASAPSTVLDSGTGTITNDDGVIAVSVDDVTAAEGNGGTTNFTFTVSLAEPPLGTESIRVSTSDGTATTADNDYVAKSQDIAFTGPGQTASFTVVVNGDTDVEPNETFNVNLSMPVGLVIVDGQGVGTITNDDVPPPDPTVVSIADAFVSEGGASNQTTISMTNSTGVLCRVEVTSSDGTAVAPGDYAAVSTVVELSDTASVVLPLTIVDDVDVEPGESFSLGIAIAAGSDPGCEIGDGTADVVIAASDGGANTPPSVTIDQAVGQADPTTTSPILFDVVFSEPVTGFDAGDVDLTGSTTDAALLASVSGGPQNYTVSVAATGATVTGTIVATVPAGAASDGSDTSLASTSSDNSVTLSVPSGDQTPPTVTIDQAVGQADPTGASPILFTVVFSEPVTGFVTGDVTLGGTAGATTAVVSGSGPTYTIAVSGMSQDGTVIASLAAGVASDAATNPSGASTSTDNQVTYDFDEGDLTPPTVTIDQAAGQADPTGASPISFTVVFSEPVTGFATGDVTLGGTAGATTATVSGSGATYTVAVSGMTGPGTVTASISAGTAVDAALNPSAASTSTDNVVTYAPDASAPITLDLPDDITQPNDPGQAGAVVTFPAATASGGVPPVSVTCSRASGSFFPLGTTTISCTATDSEANGVEERFVEAIVTDSFTITVIDTEPPVMATPPGIVRQATSTSGIAVSYSTPTATDNAGTPTVTCAPVSGTVFRIGVTTVTCTATDAAGNSTSRSFTVTVSAPSSGVPATGSDTLATLLLAGVLVAVGLATRRVGRRGSALAG